MVFYFYNLKRLKAKEDLHRWYLWNHVGYLSNMGSNFLSFYKKNRMNEGEELQMLVTKSTCEVESRNKCGIAVILNQFLIYHFHPTVNIKVMQLD